MFIACTPAYGVPPAIRLQSNYNCKCSMLNFVQKVFDMSAWRHTLWVCAAHVIMHVCRNKSNTYASVVL